MADNNFKGTVESLFQGMNSVISSKTVVGEAIHIGDTIILPLVDVSFGIGAGSFVGSKNDDSKEQAGGGLGGKMTPSAVLVIQNGTTRLVNIKNQDTITKILDMVPDFVDKVTGKAEKKVTEEELNEILDEE
ncbi:MAG: GerW family sporulation protein [Eubacteriales bacterium]